MAPQLVFVLLLFFLKHKVTYASSCTPQPSTENDVYLQGFTLESFKVNTIFPCYTKCEGNILSTSIHMNMTDKTCELKYSTKTRHPEKIVERQNMIYMEIREDNASNGSRPDIPISSCKALKDSDSQAKSGVYWMKFNDSSSTPFQVFCEMTTDGGGWTLVYSYTFTQYNDFNSDANAITPIPNWPVDKSRGTWVPESTTIPLSESSHSAMDFALWKKIGNEFLIKSNITNSVACVEGTGSVVNWKEGSLTCKVVKAITPTCRTVAPNNCRGSRCGPVFAFNDFRLAVFDGKINSCSPLHDPCGIGAEDNHLTNVQNPGGALYVR